MEKLLHQLKRRMFGCALALSAICASINVMGQTTVTIGTGTTTGYQFPINSLYHYSYTQQIYPATSINQNGFITKIRFYFNAGSLNTNNDWTVYLGYKSTTTFSGTSDWLPVGQLTQVYQGVIPNPSGYGWTIELTLTNPFYYDMSLGNLVVAVDENSASYSYTSNMFRLTSGSGTRTLYAYSDGVNMGPTNPTAGNVSSSSNLADIQLEIVAPTSCVAGAAGGTTVGPSAAVCNNEILGFSVSGAPYSVGVDYQWQISSSGLPGTFIDIPGATNVGYSGMVPTSSSIRRRAICTSIPDTVYSTPFNVNVIPCVNITNGTITTCGANFYDSGGPTGNYSSSENLTYTIYPTPGNYVQVVFNTFNLETCCDNLKIYDGPNTSYPLIGQFTANPGTITATNNSGALTFVFTSDGSVIYDGWAATINCIPFPNEEVELVSIDNPKVSNCSFSNNVDITVANNGLNTITALDITLNISGLVSTVNWIGSIPFGGVEQISLPGPYYFNDGDSLSVTISNPNGVADNDPSDNVKGLRHFIALQGVYKVAYGVNNADSIATIAEAIQKLNKVGACGNVYFDINPGTYTGNYLLTEYPNWQSGIRVTFRSETKNAADVVFENTSTSTANNYIFRLDGADGIGFQHVTMKPLSATYRTAIDLLNGAHELLVDSCVIISDTTNTGVGSSNFDQILIRSANATRDDNTTITNNILKGGSRAINLGSNTTEYEKQHIIRNNKITNVAYLGVIIDRNIGLIFENNEIRISPYTTLTGGAGAQLGNVIEGGSASGNKIYNNAGLALLITNNKGGINPYVISNNFLYTGDSSTVSTSVPLRIQDAGSADILVANNSIATYSNAMNAAGIVVVDGSSIRIINNNIASYKDAAAVRFEKTYSVIESNNNNFYVANSPNIGAFGAAYLTSLSNWQSATNMDANSLDVPAGFNGEDLHTCQLALDGAAMPLLGITVDVDGDARAAAFDIGADEFLASAAGLLDEDEVEKCPSANVTLGNAPISGVTYSWSDGSTGSTLTTNAAGQYVVTATSSCGSFSDTVLVTNKPAVNAAFSIGSISGLAVVFNNTSSNASGYNWNFGDGNTSTDENPIHMYTAAGQYVVTLTVYSECDTVTVSNVVNVLNVSNEEFSTANVRLYPNPASNYIQLESLNGTLEVSEMEICDITGKMVRKVSVNDKFNTLEIDLDGLNSGVYMLKYRQNESLVVLKFIKN